MFFVTSNLTPIRTRHGMVSLHASSHVRARIPRSGVSFNIVVWPPAITTTFAYIHAHTPLPYGSGVILPLAILPLVITSNITGNYLVIKSITR